MGECVTCGTRFTAEDRFCVHCGARVGPAQEPRAQVASHPVAPAPEGWPLTGSPANALPAPHGGAAPVLTRRRMVSGLVVVAALTAVGARAVLGGTSTETSFGAAPAPTDGGRPASPVPGSSGAVGSGSGLSAAPTTTENIPPRGRHRTLSPTMTLSGHSSYIQSIAFDPAGDALAAAAGENGAIIVWSPSDGRVLQTLSSPGTAVGTVAYSPDGSLLASGGPDGVIQLWDTSRWAMVHRLTGHGDDVGSLSFSRDGRLLASGSADRTARVWDLRKQRQLVALTGSAMTVNAVAFSPDGSTVAGGCSDQAVRLWRVADGHLKFVLTGHQGQVTSVCWAPDGRRLASGSSDRTARLWDPETGSPRYFLSVSDNPQAFVNSVAFSPDGQTLATGDGDGVVRLWNLETSMTPATLLGNTSYVDSVAYSPDGSTVASGGYDKKVRLWRVT